MDKAKLAELLGSGLFGGEDNEVVIALDQPSIGYQAASFVEIAYDGFDWDQGRFIIVPTSPLVSWEYLEKYKPGIREEIDQAREDYAHRPLRVIVAGSRGIGHSSEEFLDIKKALDNLVCHPYITYDMIEIVSGCAAGADTAGAKAAHELGYAVKEFPANWDKFGKAAGAIRNKEMLDYICEDDLKYKPVLIAFWDGESHGTKNMIEIAKKANVEVRIFIKGDDGRLIRDIEGEG